MDVLLKVIGALGGRKFLVAVGTVVFQVAQDSGGHIQWGVVVTAVAYIIGQALVDWASGGAASTAVQVQQQSMRARAMDAARVEAQQQMAMKILSQRQMQPDQAQPNTVPPPPLQGPGSNAPLN